MTRRNTRKISRWPQILVIGGVVVLIVAILIMKDHTGEIPQTGLPSEKQLQQALVDGEPTAVFFHSLTCDSCTQMMDVVSEVHPEFADSVVLVDVNVSDTRNHDLLRAEDIQVIPTLVLYDRQGQKQIIYGTVPPDQLRQLLKVLAGS